LRKAALEARRSLTIETRDCASSKICERIVHAHEFMSCKTIACYLPINDEVDPTAVIERAWRAKKRVFSPVTDGRGNMIFRQLIRDTELERNRFGLWEPISGPSIAAKAIDVVVTPVVAFDNQCHRVGMGGGYFDRFFHFLKHRQKWLRPKLIGVAFDCQKVEKIAPNPWDIQLYQVITESNQPIV
jgi:5-formyltetrahydrofolate cyclo-ligase